MVATASAATLQFMNCNPNRVEVRTYNDYDVTTTVAAHIKDIVGHGNTGTVSCSTEPCKVHLTFNRQDR